MNPKLKMKISKSEALALQELQYFLHKPLPEVQELDLADQGYLVQENHVVHLLLKDMELKSLPDIVRNFPMLRVLELDQNNIKDIDLTILQCFPQLRMLELNKNRIKHLDLTPVKFCPNLGFLELNDNQIEKLDLKPLKNCPHLNDLELNNNRLKEVDLSFLNESSELDNLELLGNPLKSLDITPLLMLREFKYLWIDNNVELLASPVHRDYSVDLQWFISDYLYRVKWLLSKDEQNQYAELFTRYQQIVQHFRHGEFWADYRDRRLALSNEESVETSFFEHVVQRYCAIKDRQRTETYSNTAEDQDIRTPWRRDIRTKLERQFINATDLVFLLKEYWETGNESYVTVDLLERIDHDEIALSLFEIVILSFWTEGNALWAPVQSISWIRILVDDKNRSYQLIWGFNRGYFRAGAKYHPRPPPEEWPLDVWVSTEVMYEITRLTTQNALDIITQGDEWLAHGYYPCLEPTWHNQIYSALASKPGF